MPRVLPIILCCGFIFQLNGENRQSAGWERLEACRLVNSPSNDGDSFLIRHGDQQSIFRTYWADAPESTDQNMDRLREEAQYFSIPETQVTKTGQLAHAFTKKFLRGEFTVHTRWEDARSDGNQRYFAIIEKDGAYLSQELLAQGLARIYGMPTDSNWPDGSKPRTYLRRLKNDERQAQREAKGIWALAAGSIQMSGLERLLATSEARDEVLQIEDPEGRKVAAAEKININKAPLEELEALPGIGPALGARIIAARPIELIESLVEIRGISANTLAGFSHMIITEDPPPPEKTVAFYMADLDRYLDSEVVVVVDKVKALDMESPDGFHAVQMVTAFGGEPGGAITSFIPEEFYDSFAAFYKEPGKEFTGLLYRKNEGDEVVLVYRRK